MKAVKTIAALIFLTALGTVLVQPVLSADDEPVPPQRKTGMAAEPSEPADTPPGDDGEDTELEEGRLELTARYPKRCMRRKEPPSTGLVAARRGSRVAIGLPDGGIETTAAVEGDAAWSPSAKYLAERGGAVFDTTGAPVGTLFFRPVRWQWSPVADCALAVTEAGNLTYSVPDSNKRGIQLVDAPVADFALSPNGRRVAFVTQDSALWIAKLRTGKAMRLTDGPASLVGWYSSRVVLYSKSPGSGKLRYGRGMQPRVVKGAFASATPAQCEDRTLLTAPASERDAPLAELVSRNGRVKRRVLPGTPAAYAGFSAASCSPDGAFVVASALTRSGDKGPLVLLQSDGRFVRELIKGRTANPTWTSQGVLFVKFGAAGRGRLWYIPPDGAPQPTVYRVGAPTQYDWAAR
ncbi:MAG: hypothetical protein ABR613_07670 [Actinomycetota bacterium]